MRKLSLIVLLIASCNPKHVEESRLPLDITIEATDTALQNNNGTWLYKNNCYNGWIIENDCGVIITKIPVIDGKENGVAHGWFKNGVKQYERSFKNGNRDGSHTVWYENGVLAGVNNFKNDRFEGEQRSYFQSGHLWQRLHYVNGYEEGKQQSWNDSGRVINNFTVKNGKLYGVIGRFDCMSVYKK